MNFTIKNDRYTVTVSDAGAEIISVKTASGRELMWQSPRSDFWSKHAPLLFPVCGRLKDKKYSYGGKVYDMGAHGFISQKTFEVCEHTDERIVLLSRADAQTREVYPFEYELRAEYALEGERIACRVTVKNGGDCDMPYMFGWHPGFVLPTEDGQKINDYELFFGEDVRSALWYPLQNECFVRPYGEDFPLEGGAYGLNEEQIYAIDTMIFKGTPCKTTLRAAGHPYSLEMEWSENSPYLCVWKQPDSSAEFICLEPWSSIPSDGVADEVFESRNMARLAPHASEEYGLYLKFTV